MATVTLKFGPSDHGRPITLEDMDSAEYVSGYKYEIIDGRLYVTCEAELPESSMDTWLFTKVVLYSRERPEVINFVSNKARVFIPLRRRSTVPEPDLAAYRDFPFHLPRSRLRWRNISPVLVGEVISPNDPQKDLVRNVELFLEVPSIREYWVLDGRPDPDRPTMRVFRRHGQRWRIIDVAFGETYTTRLLPGFELLLDPRR
jgi:Uma2 family endonuclease